MIWESRDDDIRSELLGENISNTFILHRDLLLLSWGVDGGASSSATTALAHAGNLAGGIDGGSGSSSIASAATEFSRKKKLWIATARSVLEQKWDLTRENGDFTGGNYCRMAMLNVMKRLVALSDRHGFFEAAAVGKGKRVACFENDAMHLLDMLKGYIDLEAQKTSAPPKRVASASSGISGNAATAGGGASGGGSASMMSQSQPKRARLTTV